MGSGLVGFPLIAVSRNWLIWGSGVMGTVPPGSARPQMSKCQNTESERPGSEGLLILIIFSFLFCVPSFNQVGHCCLEEVLSMVRGGAGMHLSELEPDCVLSACHHHFWSLVPLEATQLPWAPAASVTQDGFIKHHLSFGPIHGAETRALNTEGPNPTLVG